MKAIVLNSGEGYQNLELSEFDLPKLQSNEVLIKTKYVSINPVDWKILSRGAYQLPIIPGTDVSGTVELVGSQVSKYQRGDFVISYPGVGPRGTFAEYVVAKASTVAKKPRDLSFEKAAALPVVGLTAWQALFKHVQLNKGERVLVHAAAGGVGHIATQFAKRRGAYVFGTASKQNHDFIRKHGVDVAIDYNVEDFTEIAKDIDLVVSTIGGDTLRQSAKVLNENGRIAVVAGHDLIPELKSKGIDVRGFRCEPDGNQLEEIADFVANGTFDIAIEEIFDWYNFKEAIERSISGRTVGKLVMQIS